MKSTHSHLAPEAERFHPLAHLACGFVGECDRQYMSRLRDCAGQVRRPASDHAGFATARTGQHQQRAVCGGYRFALDVVEVVE